MRTRISRLLLGGETLVLLTLAGLLRRIVPPRRTAMLLGPAATGPSPPVTPGQAARARRVGRAVDRASAMVPWKASCFDEALAVRAMLRLRRIPCRNHFGVGVTPVARAHTWVTVGHVVVQGGGSEGLTEVARF